MAYVIMFVAAGIIMGLLDFVWLGFIAKRLYYDEMGEMLLKRPNMVPAITFYVIYVIGTVVLVVNPAFRHDSWSEALGYGALFGLVAYATYDLTNLATMKGFSSKIVVIDMMWGICITAAVAVGSFFAVTWLS